MELKEAIRGRRSIRKYLNRDIPNSVIEELLILAIQAPSSMNGQPWHFIVIREDKIKKRLVEIKNKYCPIEKQSYRADFLSKAPVIIVVCVDKQNSYEREVENGVLATANLMLGAYSRGIGSVYLSAYRHGEPRISEEIREVLNISQELDPITIVPLGYPDEIPEPKNIKPLKEMISYETYCKQ
ncbi:MAG: nitroreductase family protein [Syntrophaceae bacterium]|nr:nitroreductase family protein [Syntrophaceae bacterium]